MTCHEHTKHLYVVDSDVLIAAKNAYYAFEICPGFWKGLIYGSEGDGGRYPIDNTGNLSRECKPKG
ncbi:MAG: DUF4411 family protein [Deltaproteobacteria bacterium]|nr:DUF4411 family protein [Deltaproteobacteria bacterium]